MRRTSLAKGTVGIECASFQEFDTGLHFEPRPTKARRVGYESYQCAFDVRRSNADNESWPDLGSEAEINNPHLTPSRDLQTCPG